MKKLKRILKWFICVLLIPILYFIISLALTAVTINKKNDIQTSDKTIYLSTNGVHLDIIIPKNNIDSLLLSGIKHEESDMYLSFGWGDENFYINTPTWSDLTFKNAFKALFLKSSTLMHVTRYKNEQSDWIKIKIDNSKLNNLNSYILNTFKTNKIGSKIILENKGYTQIDDFYKANGSYSCLNTCNSWVNTGFKKSGLKSCLWTPFDFGLINKYE